MSSFIRAPACPIVALLASADWVRHFAFVRDRLGLSDSALSKQLATLEEAGYVTTERPVRNRGVEYGRASPTPDAGHSTRSGRPCVPSSPRHKPQ